MLIINKKGFTLIELLVVIAIIALLATVVMVALGNAREKGVSSSVRSQVASMKAQGELYYNTTGNRTYGLGGATPSSVCNTNTSAIFLTGANTLNAILNGIYSDGVPAVRTYCYTNGTAVTPATGWAFAVIDPGVPAGTQAFCIDSAGNGLKTTAVSANNPAGAVNVGSPTCL